MDLAALKKNVPYQWKVGQYNHDKTKGSCIAYIDARDVMDLLDEVVGPGNWKDEYAKLGDKETLCTLSIKIGDERVAKQDVGVSGDRESEKTQVSDAFKRAGVKRGIGRFLYNMEVKRVDVKTEGNKSHPVDKDGKRIYDLTKHLNGENTPKTPSTPHAKASVNDVMSEINDESSAQQIPDLITEKQSGFIYKLFEGLGYAQPDQMYVIERYKKPIKEFTKSEASTLIDNLNNGKILKYEKPQDVIPNDDLPF